MARKKGYVEPLVKIMIPYFKRFKNQEYLWQDAKNVGFYIEGFESPVFLSKSSINGDVEFTDTALVFWITRQLATAKKIEQFKNTDHIARLF